MRPLIRLTPAVKGRPSLVSASQGLLARSATIHFTFPVGHGVLISYKCCLSRTLVRGCPQRVRVAYITRLYRQSQGFWLGVSGLRWFGRAIRRELWWTQSKGTHISYYSPNRIHARGTFLIKCERIGRICTNLAREIHSTRTIVRLHPCPRKGVTQERSCRKEIPYSAQRGVYYSPANTAEMVLQCRLYLRIRLLKSTAPHCCQCL
jgi:hypothetical protein